VPEETEKMILAEIRDLLRPISVVAMPRYREIMAEANKQAVAAIAEIAGRSSVQIKACQLMNGSRTAAEIRAEAKMDSGNFSKFLKKLREAEAVAEVDGKLRLTVPADAITWKQT
jgi:hypothetical protein